MSLLYNIYRQKRDVLLQRLPHDPSDLYLTEREWMAMYFNLFMSRILIMVRPVGRYQRMAVPRGRVQEAT